jgi:hypothetical protein
MKFEIKVRETYQKTFIIEAEDDDEAIEIMNEKEIEMDTQDYVDNSYYLHSIKKLDNE